MIIFSEKRLNKTKTISLNKMHLLYKMYKFCTECVSELQSKYFINFNNLMGRKHVYKNAKMKLNFNIKYLKKQQSQYCQILKVQMLPMGRSGHIKIISRNHY